MSKMQSICAAGEVFWDDFMIEPDRTNAELRLHKPVKKSVCSCLTNRGRATGAIITTFFKDEDENGVLYRMYYLGWTMIKPDGTHNGSRTSKSAMPKAATVSNGSAPTSVYANSADTEKTTSFWIRKRIFTIISLHSRTQTRTASPTKNTRALPSAAGDGTLWGYVSTDAKHWTRKGSFDKAGGKFDSLNVCHWDKYSGKYRCYIRDFHDNEETDEYAIRDVPRDNFRRFLELV